MVEVSLWSLILGFLSIILLLVAGVAYLVWRRMGLIGRLWNEPLRCQNEVRHVREMRLILQAIPQLSFEERLTIIQRLYGRPTRIQVGADRAGEFWIESTTYFASEDESDFNFHFERLKDRKEVG